MESREERDTRTATAWGMQEIGAGELHEEVRAGGGNTRKSPFAAANKAGAWGRHGARPVQRGIQGGRRKTYASETLGVRGDDGVCKARQSGP